MTVEELLHRISALELAEWEAYFRLEAEEADGKVTIRDEAGIMSAFRRIANGHDRQP